MPRSNASKNKSKASKPKRRKLVTEVSQPVIEEVSPMKDIEHEESTGAQDKTLDEAPPEPEIVMPTSEQVKENALLKDCVMADVTLTDLPSNALSANRKSTFTRLQSIKNITICTINTRQLRGFCTKVGIRGVRTAGKEALCNAIITAKTSKTFIEQTVVTVKKETGEEVAVSTRISVNRKRLINVLFGDICRDDLANLGTTLERAELDNGKKKDQDFFELVAVEYNTKGVHAYDNDAYPHLKKGRSIPPNHFQEIDWIKCRELFKAICNDYDTCFKNWVRYLFIF